MVLYVSFLPFVILYIGGVRKKVRKYGEEELQARREQAKVVMDTFRGYTELKVSGAFLTRRLSFLESIDKVKDTRIKLDTVYRLPMFFSELSIILGLTLLVVLGSGDVKVLIGIFAVAAFRLLPAIRAILSGWTQIQNVSGYLKTIEDGIVDADNKETSITEDIAFENELKVSGLCYAYPNGKKVLDNFQLTIKKGEYIGFRGYSGAGKSTLFNLLLGLLKPTEGEIRIDGKLLTPDVQSAWLHHVGYVPQEVFLFQGTLAENIALGCKQIDKERIKEILGKVSLDKWAASLPNGLDTVLGEAGGKLSGGQKQRIGIARALYKQADVLFLDEATSALDYQTEKEVNETLSQLMESYEGLTILSIAHRESSLRYCDRIITLEDRE
jgi:ABC-type multidrug transport system fused ATPase/permease subunit